MNLPVKKFARYFKMDKTISLNKRLLAALVSVDALNVKRFENIETVTGRATGWAVANILSHT
jgi:hypothetical protein